MKSYSVEDIESTIKSYLNSQFETALKKAIADMRKPTDNMIIKKGEQLKGEFLYEDWIKNFKNSLEFMKSEKLSFATHTSKGVHSSVRSDNIILFGENKNSLPLFASSSSVEILSIDANSNNTGSHAGHLKNIVNFLNIRTEKHIIYLLIMNRQSGIYTYFKSYLTLEDFEYLYDLLNNEITQPKTDERNKQVLFPLESEDYICLIPLYPASLANYFFKQIQYIKYSETFKKSREAKKSKKISESYKDIIDLAVTKLGGDNAQNVSRLNNEQSGINYLLPSIPPPSLTKAQTDDAHTFKPSKFASSIFNSKQLTYQCRFAIERIFAVVKDTRNIVDVRDKRKQALDEVLHIIFTIAASLRHTMPAGWTKEYQLDMHQKLWLDPNRGELDGEAAFAEMRIQDDWHTAVINDFASWVNQLLKTEFAKQKAYFGDAEYIEWEREIEDMQKQYERAGKGVFL